MVNEAPKMTTGDEEFKRYNNNRITDYKLDETKFSAVVMLGQTLRSIFRQACLLLNILVTIMLSPSSFNYDTDQQKVCE